MLVTTVGFLILILKSIWAIIMSKNHMFYWFIFLILAMLIKILCIFVAWIVSVRKEEVPNLREKSFYHLNK